MQNAKRKNVQKKIEKQKKNKKPKEIKTSEKTQATINKIKDEISKE